MSGKELRAGILEVLFLRGLGMDDSGRLPAKHESGLDLQNLKGISLFDVYFTNKYIQ